MRQNDAPAIGLFICHASEDQEDFVRPLAEALRAEFKVWYSEYELKLGDSLRKKIDEGLASCDFGIVVLSKPFFGKKWTSAELDGLFALETESRKIILPVWKDVDQSEVAAFSPMLAGRMAVSTQDGMEKVIQEIRLAVTFSQRQRAISAGVAAQNRVRDLRQSFEDRKRSDELFVSKTGAEIAWNNLQNLFTIIRQALSVCDDGSSPIKFEITPTPASNPHALSIRTVHGMYLDLHATNMLPDWVREAELKIEIFHRSWDRVGRPTSALVTLHQQHLKPRFFTGERLRWVDSDSDSVYDTEQLANHAIDLFMNSIDEIAREPTT